MKKALRNLVLVMAFTFMFSAFMPTQAEAITNLKQKTTKKNSATITWKKSAGEVSYRVEYEKDKKVWKSDKLLDLSYGQIVSKNYKFVQSKMLNKTSYTMKGLQTGRTYDVTVKAYDKNGKEIPYAEKTLTVKTLPGKVEVLSSAFGQYEVDGEENNEYLTEDTFANTFFIIQDSADGYQVQLCDYTGKVVAKRSIKTKQMGFVDETADESGIEITENFDDTGMVSFASTIKSVPMYQIKIRAYCNVRGKKVYGPWGTGVGLGQPTAQYKKSSDGTVSFRWDKNIAATGYELYLFNENNISSFDDMKLSAFNKRLVKSVGAGVTMVTLPKKHFKKGLEYYYIVLAKKKVGGKVYKTSAVDSYRLKFTY